MILVNFKTYEMATGEHALSLVNSIKDISENSSVRFITCPQAVDLKTASQIFPNGIWAQHVDAMPQGKSTGWFPAEIAKASGAKGVILNHSEHKLATGELGEILTRCKEVGLETLAFADSPKEAKLVSQFKPDWIGYEPPELIASKETSVAKAKPDTIAEVVKTIADAPILVGAGVKDSNDVRVALELGAKGVALSSAVILAEDPRQVLEDLIKGFSGIA